MNAPHSLNPERLLEIDTALRALQIGGEMSDQSNAELSAGSSSVTHTPTPWRRATVAGRNPRNRSTIIGANGRSVASIEINSEEDAANAAYLLKATAALPAILGLLEDCGNALGYISPAMSEEELINTMPTIRRLRTKIDSFLKELR